MQDNDYPGSTLGRMQTGHIDPYDMNKDPPCYLDSDWLEFGIEGDWSSLYNTGYNTGSITGQLPNNVEPSEMAFI